MKHEEATARSMYPIYPFDAEYRDLEFYGNRKPMRPVGRISGVLSRLEKIWEKYPDLRLGQLLLNALGDPHLYYIEDDTLMDRIETLYGRPKEE